MKGATGLPAGAAATAALPERGRRPGWRRWAWLDDHVPLLVLLAGLAVRLAVWWANRGYEPFGDEQYYHRAALLFAQTGTYIDPPTPAWLPVQRVPLLSLLTGGLFRLGGVDLGPVNLIQIGLSLATCWFVWRWAASLWGERAGRWALALAVFSPPLITHSASFLYTETLYAFTAAAAMWLLVRVGGGAWGGDGGGGAGRPGDDARQDGKDTSTNPHSDPSLSPHLPSAPPTPAIAHPRRSLVISAPLLVAAAVGVMIGLTCLTRSSGLTLLAVALVWLTVTGRRAPRRTALLAATLLLAWAVVIAPWTARNWRTSGGFLLLDTIGAYNLWRDNALPGDAVAATLARLPNPIEQGRVATERGLANLRVEPGYVLARLPAKLLYLWHLEADSYARGGGYFEDLTNRTDSFAWVIAADLAHLAVNGAALVGLALAPWRRGRTPAQARLQGLLLLWIVANMLSGVVFHSESRFRIAYLPQLIAFAALPLVAGHQLLHRARARPGRAALAGGLVLLSLAGAWSPRLLPVLHMQAWVATGDALAGWDRPSALAAYERAVDAFPASDRPLIVLGDARRANGDVAGAMDAYRAALKIEPHNVGAAVPLAHLLRGAGADNEARGVLRAAGASDTDLLAWGWRSYAPPPLAALDVGTGLEIGYLRNVYPPERGPAGDFRWTNGNGLVRLTAPAGGAASLTLHLNGTRLNAPPARRVEVAINGQALPATATDGSWQALTFDLRPLGLSQATPLLIEVRSDTFVPSAVVPGNRDGRILGVAVERIEVVGP